MPDRKRSVFLRILSAQRPHIDAEPLDGPLTRSNDRMIDAALAHHELVRRDLFSNNTITSCYRGRMAEMIAALEVDLDSAVAAYWPELKQADARCATCPHPARLCTMVPRYKARDEPGRHLLPERATVYPDCCRSDRYQA